MRIGKCFCRWMLKSSDAKAQDTLRFLKVESNWFLRRNCRRLGGSCYYVDLLADFTRYSKQFVCAISSNMDNSRLWKDGKYYCDAWSCNSLLPCDEKQEQESWEHRCARFGFHVDHRCEVTSQN